MTSPVFSAQLRQSAHNNTLWPLAKQSVAALALLVFTLYLLFGDHNDSGSALSVLLGVPVLAAVLIWMSFLFKRARAAFTPGLHPLDEALRYNPNAPITPADLDASFAGRDFQPGRLNISREYVAFAGSGRVMVKRIEDLVWAYSERVTHRMNFIPYRISNHVTVWDRFGNGFTAPLGKRECEATQREIALAAPWLPIGYSELHKESWNADRAEFVMLVDQRRASHLMRA